MRKNPRITGRSWDHLHPRVQQELAGAIATYGDLPPVLGAARERELLAVVHGDHREPQRKHARSLLRHHNLKFVCEAAPRWCGRGVAPADIIQDGFLGLDYSITKYDFDKRDPRTGEPYRFTTYAAGWIDRAMQVSVTNRGSIFTPNGICILEIEDVGTIPDAPETGLDPRAERVREILATMNPAVQDILRRAYNPDGPEPWERIAREIGRDIRDVKRLARAGLMILHHRMGGTRP